MFWAAETEDQDKSAQQHQRHSDSGVGWRVERRRAVAGWMQWSAVKEAKSLRLLLNFTFGNVTYSYCFNFKFVTDIFAEIDNCFLHNWCCSLAAGIITASNSCSLSNFPNARL